MNMNKGLSRSIDYHRHGQMRQYTKLLLFHSNQTAVAAAAPRDSSTRFYEDTIVFCVREKGAARVAQLGKNSEFAEVNIDDMESLEATLHDADVVVHTTGPFQQAERCTVLEAAIKTKTAYVNVCDDTTYAWCAKFYMSQALAANIPAITTGGIYPGVSNSTHTFSLVMKFLKY
ncbi:hypothetical protein LOK49_LG12G00705 [Camellia lanceoleosa]|uniref:Uncharacterized protein n=1 Tax=Camellia lanceoleosa TaxID=1840588 RepID=A0ACC0FTZ4_9ERIC|nr:hypothetical protein LOK49_LG12G00705 [Camellia lanceoleosa]